MAIYRLDGTRTRISGLTVVNRLGNAPKSFAYLAIKEFIRLLAFFKLPVRILFLYLVAAPGLEPGLSPLYIGAVLALDESDQVEVARQQGVLGVLAPCQAPVSWSL